MVEPFEVQAQVGCRQCVLFWPDITSLDGDSSIGCQPIAWEQHLSPTLRGLPLSGGSEEP